MPDTAKGWSFLVARGRGRGYRTVLAPDFLTARHLHGLLSDVASTCGDDGQLQSVELDVPGFGRMTVNYTSDQLTAADLNGQALANAMPTDEHGRPLELLYGVVTPDRLSRPLDPQDLRSARAEALQSYRRFLADEDGCDVEASRERPLQTPAAPAPSPPPMRNHPPPPHVASTPLHEPNRPTRLAAMPPTHERRVRAHDTAPALGRTAPPPVLWFGVAAISLVLAVVLVTTWLGKDDGPQVEIVRTEIDPSSGAVRCGPAVQFRLRAIIRAGGPSEVTYHWEPAVVGRPTALSFKGKGEQRVEATVARPIGTGTTKGSYVLVIDSPQQQHRSLTYALSCLGRSG